jgi:SSS family solute:Na+ symporter
MSLGMITVIVFGLIVIMISIYGNRLSKKTAVDYMVAGREIGAFVMFFYIAFVIYSAWTFYGYPGFLYLHGPGFLVFALTAHFMFSFLFFGCGPRLWAVGRMYGVISPLEYLEQRYESPAVRVITAVVLVIFILPYIGAQCVGAGAGFQAALGVPFWVGAAYIALLMTSVVVLGGMRTVAWVNVLLGCIFIAAFAGSLLWVIYQALPGGLAQAAQDILARSPEQLSLPGPKGIMDYKMIFGLTLVGIMAMGWPHVVIGALTARNVKVLRSFSILFIILGGILFYSVATLWGIIVGPALMPGLVGKGADAVVQLVVQKFLPAWFSVAVLMAVVAAAMSTAGTQLMVAGIFITRDFVTKVIKRTITDSEMLLWTRISLIVVVVISTVLALLRPVELGLFLTDLSSPGLTQWLPLLLGALFWKRANKYGAIASLVAGVVVLVIAMNYKPIRFGYPAVVIATLVNVVTFVVVSLVTKPTSADTIKKYFEDVDGYLEDLDKNKITTPGVSAKT